MSQQADPAGEGELPIDADLKRSDWFETDLCNRPTTSRRTRRTRPGVLVAIALGGALGAPARYGVAQLVHASPKSFPWATFWTNVSGSLALGIVLVLMLERFPPSRYLRPFVATGFIGAYTTYSTFAVETDVLVKDGQRAIALGYVIASLVAGLLAMWAGIFIGRLLLVLGRGGAP